MTTTWAAVGAALVSVVFSIFTSVSYRLAVQNMMLLQGRAWATFNVAGYLGLSFAMRFAAFFAVFWAFKRVMH